MPSPVTARRGVPGGVGGLFRRQPPGPEAANEEALLSPTEVHQTEALVAVLGLTKTFRRRGRTVAALRDVELEVSEGEFVCLLGPSGCGKSTLLNVIAGILPFDEGSVTVAGRNVTGPGADRGMLFQSPMLFPWLTTRDNVLFDQELDIRRISERRNSGRKRTRCSRPSVFLVLETRIPTSSPVVCAIGQPLPERSSIDPRSF